MKRVLLLKHNVTFELSLVSFCVFVCFAAIVWLWNVYSLFVVKWNLWKAWVRKARLLIEHYGTSIINKLNLVTFTFSPSHHFPAVFFIFQIKRSAIFMHSSRISLTWSPFNRHPHHLNLRSTSGSFSHDVTKIQTKKVSIPPRFYFHDALEQLKTYFRTNFRFKRILGFVIEYAWISKLLRDAAFTWRPS